LQALLFEDAAEPNAADLEIAAWIVRMAPCDLGGAADRDPAVEALS
jgi:hypothetical protein